MPTKYLFLVSPLCSRVFFTCSFEHYRLHATCASGSRDGTPAAM